MYSNITAIRGDFCESFHWRFPLVLSCHSSIASFADNGNSRWSHGCHLFMAAARSEQRRVHDESRNCAVRVHVEISYLQSATDPIGHTVSYTNDAIGRRANGDGA